MNKLKTAAEQYVENIPESETTIAYELEQAFIAGANWQVVETSKVIDWEERRYQLAKEILCGLVSTDKKPMVTYGEHCREAIIYADEIIKQLKGE